MPAPSLAITSNIPFDPPYRIPMVRRLSKLEIRVDSSCCRDGCRRRNRNRKQSLTCRAWRSAECESWPTKNIRETKKGFSLSLSPKSLDASVHLNIYNDTYHSFFCLTWSFAKLHTIINHFSTCLVRAVGIHCTGSCACPILIELDSHTHWGNRRD